ncbi:MAG: MBL fold metallo-hydrolase [Desulfobacteraceae bacterium]|nr:MAG: MBL fold metallo-hydrolase [Desulfobacteraceae bacterium]
MNPVIRIEIPIPFPIRSVNTYFIPDSNPTLIDAGFHSEKGLDAVELAIKRTGYRLTDIKRILLTHGHLDHIGLAGKIAAMSGAEVFIHSLDRDKCIWDVQGNQEKRMAPFLRFFKEAGLPDKIIRDISLRMTDRFKRFFPGDFDVKHIEGNETFSFDDFSLKVVYSPGHTLGSVCFSDRENGRLFSGDHLLENITSNPMVEIENQDKSNGYKSLSSYLKSLEMIAAMEIKEVLPGHGARFSNAAERAREIIGHHLVRRQEVLDAFSGNKMGLSDRGGMTLFMVSQAVFPELRGWDIFLGLSETHGHLEVLEEEGLITSRTKGDQRLYCLSPRGQR